MGIVFRFGMKTSFRIVLVFLLGIVSAHAFALMNPVAGYWKTMDDKTGAARSIVNIREVNGELQGKITHIILQSGEKETDVCKNCSGDLHNQPIKGLTILSGMKKDGDAWTGGRILDPTNGKIYHCKMMLSPDGKTLFVRGYMGLPLIGRTQNWIRANSPKGSIQ